MLFFTILIITAAVITVFNLRLPGNMKFYSVVSGSMEPEIKLGSLVAIKPSEKYSSGDIITFNPQGAKKSETVTHRITSVNEDSGITYFETKGDANKTPDTEPVEKSRVIGKYLFSVPLLGYPVAYARTRDGLIILIIIPSTIIIWNELQTIKKEAGRLIRERRKRKLSLLEKAEVEIGKEEMKAEKWYKKLFKKK